MNHARAIDDNLMAIMAKSLQEEIDREFLAGLELAWLVDGGWICPDVAYANHNSEVGAWVHCNIRNEYKNLNGRWVFKDPADATFFTLRWAQ